MHKFVAATERNNYESKLNQMLSWRWAVYDSAILILISVGLICNM